MALLYRLAAVVVNATLWGGGELAAGLVQDWLGDPAGRLPEALIGAADDTRQVLELALQRQAGTPAAGWLGRLRIKAEHRALANAIADFLDTQPLILPDPDQARAALAELRSAPGQALLALDRAEIGPERFQGIARYADSLALIAAAQAAMAALADGLAGDCPNLAAVLRAQPQDQPPLLVLAYAYCLRRRIEGDPDLARGLQFEQLDALTAGLAGIGATVARIETGILALLKQYGAAQGPVRSGLTSVIRDPADLAAVHSLLEQVRRLPEPERKRYLALIGNAGKLAQGIGDFGEAQALFVEVADRASAGAETSAEAEARYNAYQAALAAKDWDAALDHLRRAAELDPDRFAPFSFHDYPPERILGAGGFGAAFLCRPLIGKPAVIKTLHNDPHRRALREGQLLAGIDHPNVIRVTDVRYAWRDRRPYLVMEYFEGSQGLDRYVETQGCLTPARVRELGLALAGALAAAHAQGILHRDVKPANVLIRDGGDCLVKLIDFGLAAQLSQAQEDPDPGAPVGTHDFSAPEARGQRRGAPVDARSDLYSLGATLSWCLCLESRPGREHWTALEREDPELADILAKCLCSRPDDRWPGAAALVEALSAAVRRDTDAWTAAEAAAGIPAYSAYLAAAAPVRRHTDQARARIETLKRAESEHARQQESHRAELERDDAAWAQARAADSVAAYRAYLAAESPWRAHTDEALAAIEGLLLRERDDGDWQEARHRGTVAALRDYLADETLPRIHAREAQALVERIESEAAKHRDEQAWTLARSQDSIAAYRGYLGTADLLHAHAEQARTRIGELERRTVQGRSTIWVWTAVALGALAIGLGAYRLFGRDPTPIPAPAPPVAAAPTPIAPPVAVAVPTPSPPTPAAQPIPQPPASPPMVQDRLPFEPEMVRIPAGRFLMGSPADEPGRASDEGPQHEVAVPAFALGKTEVTFDQWDACVADGGCTHKPNDYGWGRGQRPVIDVSWDDAQQYIAWLSRKTGRPWRLPTEAEWEYAARAGTATAYFWGNDANQGCAYANGHDETGKRVNQYSWDNLQCDDGEAHTSTVGSYRPNAFGLYDMSGNVWEWVQDSYHSGGDYGGAPADGSAWEDASGEGRVLRGGSWLYGAQGLRSACRDRRAPGRRSHYRGFRLALGSELGSAAAGK